MPHSLGTSLRCSTKKPSEKRVTETLRMSPRLSTVLGWAALVSARMRCSVVSSSRRGTACGYRGGQRGPVLPPGAIVMGSHLAVGSVHLPHGIGHHQLVLGHGVELLVLGVLCQVQVLATEGLLQAGGGRGREHGAAPSPPALPAPPSQHLLGYSIFLSLKSSLAQSLVCSRALRCGGSSSRYFLHYQGKG